MRTSWLACLMCAGCGLHNAWSHLEKEMEGHYGGSDKATWSATPWPPAVTLQHPPVSVGLPTERALHRSLSDQINSGVSTRFFNSIWGHTTECEDCNPYDHSRNRSPASVCFLEKQQHEKHVVGVWTDIVGKKPATQYSGAGATNCECDLGAVGFAFAVQTSPRSM